MEERATRQQHLVRTRTMVLAPAVIVSLVLATFVSSCAAATSPKASHATTTKASTTSTTIPDQGLALERDFVRVVKNIRPAVVEISTSSGLGSGVIYDTKGDIVTNAHVVGDATSFTVSLSNGRRLTGRLLGVFAPDDLAVIRVSPAKGLKAARFGNSASLEVGDIVLAVGNPLGLSSSVTDGIVSFNGRDVSEGNGVVLADLVQTSAAINPGNSGGALVNLSSQVIGIPTLAATNGSAAAAGLGFAIPSNTVKLIAGQLIANGKVTTAGRAALGINGATAVSFDGEAIGVAITAVQPKGPAAKGGIVVGDLITAINGTATREFTELQTVLARLKPATLATISITKADGTQRKVTVSLEDLASS
jgi:S1-C subfamily serine protease